MVTESVIGALHGGNTWAPVFVIGLLLSLVGLLVLGVAALNRGRHRWAAALPFLGMFVGIAGGDHGGSLVTAAVWAVLGARMVQSEPAVSR